ncbi:MAG: tetratricopeptide repeat protein [Acidobacteriaceae bacterium]|nr:tetratricopeptide repeat protein [Acidobacteriaceae bacterium]MBV9780187.1 tetratricopeptide repeat protein [Acidobacteriaceae bacterium]
MKRRLRIVLLVSITILVINSAVLAAFPTTATIFGIGNVLLHMGIGAAAGIAAVILSRRELRLDLVGLAAATGILLAGIGNTRDHRVIFIIHIVISVAAIAVFFARRENLVLAKLAGAAALLILIAGVCYRLFVPHPEEHITNSRIVPLSMDQEGAGPESPFFPSGANTSDGHLVPSAFFMESQKCGECHRDIYEQWKSSAHHFASFNNQFYRKSIEYMQSVVGTRPSKWCAGCHDHAVFFNGRFDRPIKEQIDTPEARAGLSCMSCHSIVHVGGSVGNGSFTMSYPPLHEVASSSNPALRRIADFVTYAAPEAHRRTFMKPFMRDSTAEYCAACHKVHLDVPVNDYRWFRGFNEYDNWQASGVSGQGARSFYYPAKSSNCADCHMPLVASHDPGNIHGQVHSHRFPGANTAVPFVNEDSQQLADTEKFLKSGFITVDIFAVSPVTRERSDTEMVRRNSATPQTMTTFAVGEEAEQTGPAVIRDVTAVAAPADISHATLEPGKTVRVDVVVRTRKIGHFFPGGTVDAFDVWLELKGEDDNGRTIFWSGMVEDNGRGPVEPGAHFYRSYQLDGAGNPINKRNAWQTRSTLYVHLIPPGAADVAHYLVTVPKDAKGQIHLTAKLNYRKFSYYYTQFSYAGEPKPNQSPFLLAKDRNGLDYSFDPKNIPTDVSGEIRGRIPDLPVITLAESHVSLLVSSEPPQWRPVTRAGTRERWNDWGIGLLLQGDLKGAEYAFRKATDAEPGYADGWLNVARALIQEGETDRAKPFIEHALKIDPSLGRIYFFRAMIEKSDGDYDGALKSLERVETQYPRDRVVLNQIGRILFLKREYAKAIEYLERVCDIDPEDVQMHYTAMLCYRGLGDAAKAKREEILFRRFKADEASQTITGARRLLSPEENNERQLIHDHESIALP